jgi:hypothetical protein
VGRIYQRFNGRFHSCRRLCLSATAVGCTCHLVDDCKVLVTAAVTTTQTPSSVALWFILSVVRVHAQMRRIVTRLLLSHQLAVLAAVEIVFMFKHPSLNRLSYRCLSLVVGCMQRGFPLEYCRLSDFDRQVTVASWCAPNVTAAASFAGWCHRQWTMVVFSSFRHSW